MSDKLPFAVGDYVVYPAHGVGCVGGLETQEIAGQELRLYVITFESSRMTLRVPVNKVGNSGLRKLSSKKQMDSALITLKGRARVKRTMWSRRAQEYEAKIFSHLWKMTLQLHLDGIGAYLDAPYALCLS